jgi:hypothetical protein
MPDLVMKRTLLALLGVVVLVPAPGVASASMIGDAITINRFYPDLATIYTPPDDSIPGTVTTTVVAGPEGASPQPTLYSIDLGSNSIVFDFLSPSAFGGATAGVFDGLQFLGFSQAIGNVSASATGISVAGLAFGSDFINLDLDGVFNGNASLTLQVDFAAPAAVPEPSTLALALLGMGAGFGRLVSRRRVRA